MAVVGLVKECQSYDRGRLPHRVRNEPDQQSRSRCRIATGREIAARFTQLSSEFSDANHVIHTCTHACAVYCAIEVQIRTNPKEAISVATSLQDKGIEG
jgi:hypothetical protein